MGVAPDGRLVGQEVADITLATSRQCSGRLESRALSVLLLALWRRDAD